MITIDSREQKRHTLAKQLSRIGETQYTFNDTQRVKAENGEWRWPADLTIEQESRTIGIQRKTVSDFVGSIGKLKETMALGREHERWDIFALLIEGEYSAQGGQMAYKRGEWGNWHDGLSFAQYHNFLFSQQCRGSPWLRTNTLRETARLLKALHSYTGPIAQVEHGTPHAVLRSLPGIGQGKAEQLLETFGSPQIALNRVSDWKNLEGFGEKTVQRCENVLL